MLFNNLFKDNDHEEIIFHQNKDIGLKTIVAIHNTYLGPAVGGVRILPYTSEVNALDDVLQLSRAMTYKSALAGVSFGGGKAVIIADPKKDKTRELLLAYGEFIESLNGKYITTTDVGSSMDDMVIIHEKTSHVCGLPAHLGGNEKDNDTSKMTGYGIYMGMKACANKIWGGDSLAGKKVVIQGFGKVAKSLVEYLRPEKAKIVVSDIDNTALKIAENMGLETYDGNTVDVLSLNCDILSPCALGGILNYRTIPHIKAKAIVGGANNQLEDIFEDGRFLHRRGILYAPDYIVNAGGVIDVSTEIAGQYDHEVANRLTENIYNTISDVITISNRYDRPTTEVANNMAESKFRWVKPKRKNL